MTYNPNIPTDLPPPKVAVDGIRTNFSQYASIFDNNHVALNSTNQGKHTHVIFQRQASNPIVDGNFDSLYGKSVTSNSGTSEQIFATVPQFLPNNLPNTPMQLTFDTVSTAVQYQSFLPGGYIVYFGTIPSASSVNTQITLVPAPSEILCVIPNPTKVGGIGANPSAPTRMFATVNNNSKFTINAVGNGSPLSTGNINWIAIARQ